MFPRFLVTFAMAAGLALVGACQQKTDPAPQAPVAEAIEKAPTPTGPQTFHAEHHGFTLTFPEGWKLLPGSGHKIPDRAFVLTALAPKNENFVVRDLSLSVMVAPMPKPVTLEELVKSNLADMKKGIKNFKLIEQGATKLGGMDAHWILHASSRKGEPEKHLLYSLIKDNDVLVMTFSGDALLFGELHDTCKQIAQSLAFDADAPKKGEATAAVEAPGDKTAPKAKEEAKKAQ